VGTTASRNNEEQNSGMVTAIRPYLIAKA